MVERTFRFKRGGGLVGFRNNLLNKKCVEMCGVAYNLAAVAYETKIHGVSASGELPPTGGICDQIRGTKGDPYVDVKEVVSNLCADTVVLVIWDPCRMCVFSVRIIGTDPVSYNGRHPHKILSCNKRQKKGRYLEDCLQIQWQITPIVFSVNGFMGE